MRIAAQVVVAVAGDRAGELLERRLLLCEARVVVGRGVAAVQPDLGTRVLEGLV